jgi:hypothetical protein
LETKKELDFLDVPVVIEVILYKNNEIDRKIVGDLDSFGYLHQRTTGLSGEDTFFCTIGEMKDLLRRRSYAFKIKGFKEMKDEELVKNIDTTFFLYNLVKNFTSLRIIKFKYLNTYESGRIVEYETEKYIGIEYRIVYGFLNMPNALSSTDLDFFNRIMISAKFMNKKYMNRSPYFLATASQLLDFLETYSLDLDTDDNNLISFSNINEVIFDLIDPKIENDNSLILVKTDYPDL